MRYAKNKAGNHKKATAVAHPPELFRKPPNKTGMFPSEIESFLFPKGFPMADILFFNYCLNCMLLMD
jgi:hypothetical protein